MSTERATIEHLSELARIALAADEVDALQRDVERMLDYVRLLESVDVSLIEATTHGVSALSADASYSQPREQHGAGGSQPRPDVPGPVLSLDQVMTLAGRSAPPFVAVARAANEAATSSSPTRGEEPS